MTAAAAPRVVAVVLNWNNFEHTQGCLAALAASAYPNLGIILVDNQSTDGSAERLHAAFPEWPLVRNAANLGFSRGCNVGIRAALEDPACAYVLLVNNDCTVAPGAIGPAVAAAEAEPAVGVVTGKVDDEQGLIWHAGGTISLLRGQAIARGYREKDHGQYDTPCDTRWATGAMMLVRRAVLESVGALPEEYFFGVEEWDYSLQVVRGGWRIRYLPAFTGVHPGGGSHDNHDPKFAYNYYRNKLVFQEKYLGRALFTVWLAFFRVYLAVRLRPHIRRLASPGSPVDDVVFAARTALRDHRKNALSEETMLAFDRMLRARRG